MAKYSVYTAFLWINNISISIAQRAKRGFLDKLVQLVREWLRKGIRKRGDNLFLMTSEGV